MSYLIPAPKIRFESVDGDSSPVEAALQRDGRIRIQSDPDSLSMNSAWLLPSEVRELALELLGLADASDVIHAYEPEANRAHVRALLAQNQPDWAAALETAAAGMS